MLKTLWTRIKRVWRDLRLREGDLVLITEDMDMFRKEGDPYSGPHGAWSPITLFAGVLYEVYGVYRYEGWIHVRLVCVSASGDTLDGGGEFRPFDVLKARRVGRVVYVKRPSGHAQRVFRLFAPLP